MSGSRKYLNNIDAQLKNYQKSYNKTNSQSVGKQIAILDCVKFKTRKDHNMASICESKAKQHKSARKKGNACGHGQKIMGHTDYSERSF